ncbi:MAG: flagellar biosynthesis anti-sigma factor FlgM [Nitrospina sp.]|jgi:negative regulator of flagellin synthesis FlgM|nr:flagellar biosynthesis anti-sigma factor FlgM [Nitrospina sp.]MBT6600672.1 flagellar biosynthesis anti-sigma factor FlgM [Nitrospina sp.]
MEIPGNDFKSKAVQDRIKVTGKDAAKAAASGGPSSVKGTQGSEHIALSSKAKDIQKSHEAVKNSSDIRVDRVDRIKAAIADGSFHVDSKDLAEKILKDMILEAKFLD